MPETNPLPFHPQADIIEKLLTCVKQLKKHPYPDHICAKVGRITMFAGKVAEAADNVKYQKESDEETDEVRRLAFWTAAQCIRLIENLSPKTIKTNDSTATKSAENIISEDSEGQRG